MVPDARMVLGAAAPTLLLMAAVLARPWSAPLFHALFPELRTPVYARAGFASLLLAHARLVLLSTGVAGLCGVAAAVFVTRPSGRPFAALARLIGTLGQSVPPVAVLALAVPMLGYGTAPTLAALVLYAVLPVLEASLAGLGAVPSEARDAADGLGFSPLRRLLAVELPLAAPLILTGLRSATIINIGTATIGSSVGALSLGSPIIEGLAASNPAYVVQGAVVVALLAISVDRWFEVLAGLARPAGADG